jgi:transcriptional antiterminator NusG
MTTDIEAPASLPDSLETPLAAGTPGPASVASESVSADPIADAPDSAADAATDATPATNPNFKWYVVKVASGREESIKAAIERRMKIDNLEPFVGQIVIPVERVTEVRKVSTTKNGEKKTVEKRVIKEKKKFPGYLMAQVEFNAEVLTLFRDTSGVGDFVGATGPGKPPPPMSDRDVQSMLYGMQIEHDKGPANKIPVKVKLDFEKGDKVRIREGAFASMEGEVAIITEPKDNTETPKVQVIVKIFDRPVPVDLDYWQVDKV